MGWLASYWGCFELASADAEAAAGRLVPLIVNALRSAAADTVTTEGTHITFSASMFRLRWSGMFRLRWSWKALAAITRGEIGIERSGQALTLTYRIRFTEVLAFSFFLIPFMGAFMLAFNFPTPMIAFGLPAMWCWLFGMNKVISVSRFDSLMRRPILEAGCAISKVEHSRFHPAWLLALMGVLVLAYPMFWAVRAELSLTPLHRAVMQGDIGEIHRLAAADPGLLEACDHRGLTPLHLAVDESPTVVNALLDCGADPNARGQHGSTPLHCGVLGRANPEAAGVLIARGADVNARDEDGETPLHWAVLSGNQHAVELLTEHQADVRASDNNGNTPLSLAARRQRYPSDREIYALLMQHDQGRDAVQEPSTNPDPEGDP